MKLLDDDDIKELLQRILDWSHLSSHSKEISFMLDDEFNQKVPDSEEDIKTLAYQTMLKKNGKIYLNPKLLEETLQELAVIVCDLLQLDPDEIDKFERKVEEENLN